MGSLSIMSWAWPGFLDGVRDGTWANKYKNNKKTFPLITFVYIFFRRTLNHT